MRFVIARFVIALYLALPQCSVQYVCWLKDLVDLIDSLLEKKENSRLAINCYVEVLDHAHDVVVDDLLEAMENSCVSYLDMIRMTRHEVIFT